MNVNEAMSKLEGLKPDDIAAFLQDQGIIGRRAHVISCAIARYLQITTGDQNLGSGTCGAVLLDGCTASNVYTYPENVSKFIFNFDMGLYPDLVEE